MNPSITTWTTLIAIASCALNASASNPQLGGPMSHLLVSIFNQQVFLTFESPSMSTVTMTEGSTPFDGPASILNHTGYNAQFGWLANGFISLPPNSGVFVRSISQSQHLDVYSEFEFNPILGTDDSDETWQWNGTMVHNWYATDVQGTHHARYEVFVGDHNGNPLDGWISGTIDLNFIYGDDLSDRIHPLHSSTPPSNQGLSAVPTPATTPILAGIFAIGSRRRRT